MDSPNSNNGKTGKATTFGNRYLRDDGLVFEHNAWDNVDFPEQKESEIKAIIEMQRDRPVDSMAAERLLETSRDQWNAFYRTHNDGFFMNRNWIVRELPELQRVC